MFIVNNVFELKDSACDNKKRTSDEEGTTGTNEKLKLKGSLTVRCNSKPKLLLKIHATFPLFNTHCAVKF